MKVPTAARTDVRPRSLAALQVVAQTPFAVAPLLAMARDRRVAASDVRLAVGNLDREAQLDDHVAILVLAGTGRRRVAHASPVDVLNPAIDAGREGIAVYDGDLAAPACHLRYGASLPAPVDLDLDRDVARVLLAPDDRRQMVTAYAKAVASAEVPKTLHGLPFRAFFQASEDPHNALALEAFRRDVPGFSARELEEQQMVAALAEHAVATMPTEAPLALRRRVAVSQVSVHRVPGPPGAGLPVGPRVRFYHGTGAAEAIGAMGFQSSADGHLGPGVYTANPTVAAGYAVSDPASTPQVIFGDAVPGRVGRGLRGTKVDSASASRRAAHDVGGYLAIRDPRRLAIRGWVALDPPSAEGLSPYAMDLLATAASSPDWAGGLLDRLDPATIREVALKAADDGVGFAASVALAKDGEPRDIEAALEELQQAQASQAQRRIATALLVGLTKGKVSPDLRGRVMGSIDRLSPVVQATAWIGVLAADPSAWDGVSYRWDAEVLRQAIGEATRSADPALAQAANALEARQGRKPGMLRSRDTLKRPVTPALRLLAEEALYAFMASAGIAFRTAFFATSKSAALQEAGMAATALLAVNPSQEALVRRRLEAAFGQELRGSG